MHKKNLKKSEKRNAMTTRQKAIAAGYRSGLEEKVAAELDALGVGYKYEAGWVRYVQPEKERKYKPDTIIERTGVIIETKGVFNTADRQKHLMVKEQHPDLEIRFVFSNPNARISKQSKTTYAMWCQKNGFLYAKQSIPQEWLQEEPNEASIAALKSMGLL